jgi:glutaredoxin
MVLQRVRIRNCKNRGCLNIVYTRCTTRTYCDDCAKKNNTLKAKKMSSRLTDLEIKKYKSERIKEIKHKKRKIKK